MLKKSFQAGEALNPYRFGTLSTDGKAVAASDETETILFVTSELETDVDEVVDVTLTGECEIETGGVISAGSAISVDANGCAVAASEGSRVVGYLLDEAATASGQVLRALLV